jgi:hypothetical protein
VLKFKAGRFTNCGDITMGVLYSQVTALVSLAEKPKA